MCGSASGLLCLTVTIAVPDGDNCHIKMPWQARAATDSLTSAIFSRLFPASDRSSAPTMLTMLRFTVCIFACREQLGVKLTRYAALLAISLYLWPSIATPVALPVPLYELQLLSTQVAV